MKKDLEKVIVADPESNAWNFAESVYKEIQKLEQGNGEQGMFSLVKINIPRFPDKEFEPRIMSNVRRRDVIFIHDSSLEPARWWTELMLVNNAANLGSAEKVIDVLSYMRFSRAEKKDKPHMPIAAKVLADTISQPSSGARASRIITMDLHAPAVQGFFNIPVDVLYSYHTAIDNIACYDVFRNLDDLVVVAADVGSADRTRAFTNRIKQGLDIAITDKKRIHGGKVVVYNVIGEVEGKRCFVVDDILSSGGTLREAGEALKKRGAKELNGYATHFVGAGDYNKNLEDYNMFFSTDTFHQKEPGKVKIISMAPLFALAIYRAARGESISEMFN